MGYEIRLKVLGLLAEGRQPFSVIYLACQNTAKRVRQEIRRMRLAGYLVMAGKARGAAGQRQGVYEITEAGRAALESGKVPSGWDGKPEDDNGHWSAEIEAVWAHRVTVPKGRVRVTHWLSKAEAE